MPMTSYGDIQPRTAALVSAELLKRGVPTLVLEKFGQAKTLPAHKTKSMNWRRYNSLPVALTPLTEGVTPPSKKLSVTDVSVTLNQYGDLVEISDVVADTHEDPVIQENQGVLSEQAAKTVETIRYNVLKGCSNKFFARQVAARANVVNSIDRGDQRRVVRTLERQHAAHITQVVKSTVNFNTESVLPAFMGVCHTDLTGDIRNLSGFVGVENYGKQTPYETEIGSCEDVRYVKSTIFESYPDAGGAKGTLISTTGVNCDVYPIIYLAKDAYGIVALKGEFAISPTVINPTPSKSDPLGQRGSISWKTMQGAVILNDFWMMVYECGCTD
jgi:N4-gp56 family major capsid protein